ncbi:MAG: hypothetical protein HFF14_09570 [Angelakisella sp.]|nr:hypothetical protein [Angelakisella sp.]
MIGYFRRTFNPQHPKISKWFFYAFYPAHLLIIFLLQLFL